MKNALENFQLVKRMNQMASQRTSEEHNED